jgi:hypothetical protein
MPSRPLPLHTQGRFGHSHVLLWVCGWTCPFQVHAAPACVPVHRCHQRREGRCRHQLPKILNRIDSMAERLRRLEIQARDDQRHAGNRSDLDERGPFHSNYPQGAGTYHSLAEQDGRYPGQRGVRQSFRPPQQGYHLYMREPAGRLAR